MRPWLKAVPFVVLACGSPELVQLEPLRLQQALGAPVRLSGPVAGGEGDSHPTGFTRAGANVFFWAETAQEGFELWRASDDGGVLLLRDIHPGQERSRPTRFNNVDFDGLAVLGSSVFFGADDGQHGTELWTSDGTSVGTRRLFDNCPTHYLDCAIRSSPVAYNGAVYFLGADDTGSRDVLYVTDGTPGGSTTVGTVGLTSLFNAVAPPVARAGKLFFTARTDAGEEPWISDGTDAGTFRFADLAPGMSSSLARQFTAVGNTVFFIAGFNRGLYKTDPNDAGASLIRTFTVLPHDLTAVGDRLAFAAVGDGGEEPWVSDGTAAGTLRLADLNGGPAGSSPRGFVELGGSLYLSANDGDAGQELWRVELDGGAALVADLSPGAGSASPSNIVRLGSLLVFDAQLPQGRRALATDGTSAPVSLLPGFASLPNSIDPFTGFFVAGNEAWFEALGGTGGEPWKTDGTAAGTVNAANVVGAVGGLRPRAIVADGARVFFIGTPRNSPSMVHVSDGTAAGTVRINDTYDPDERFIAAAFGRAWLVRSMNFVDFELWRTDLAGATAELAFDFTPDGGNTVFTGLGFSYGKLFVGASAPGAGVELWVFDGPDAGPRLLDLYPGASSSGPADFFSAGGWTYFVADHPDAGVELWRTDGTLAGTEVFDLAPSNSNSQPFGPTRTADGTLWCSAIVGGLFMARPDAGAIRVPGVSNASYIAPVGDEVFFMGNGPEGYELFKSSGAGQTLVTDFWPGAQEGTPSFIAAAGSRLVMVASDGDGGRQLFGVDSTNGAPQVLPGAFATPRTVFSVNRGTVFGGPSGGPLFFAASQADEGAELWVTDGTALGTMRWSEIAPGTRSSNPTTFVVAGRRLFFAAWTPAGQELYSIDLDADGGPGVFDAGAGGGAGGGSGGGAAGGTGGTGGTGGGAGTAGGLGTAGGSGTGAQGGGGAPGGGGTMTGGGCGCAAGGLPGLLFVAALISVRRSRRSTPRV